MRTLLTGGKIIDGSGSEGYDGHVVLEGDTIKAVGAGKGPEGFAGEIIDTSGLAIAPGFIDAHTHSDWFAARSRPQPFFVPFVEQGITTQVVGNCGFSPFGYARDTAYRHLSGGGLFSPGDAEGDFSSFEGWRVAAEARTPVNLVPLQGHGAIRTGLSGYDSRPLDEAGMRGLAAKIEESYEQGVFGLSLGLMYEPDRYATPAELRQAAELTRRHGGILSVHGRAYSAASTSYGLPFGGTPHNLRALDEMLALGLETGVKLQYSHLIFVGRSTWRTMDAALDRIDAAREKGLDVGFDIFSPSFGVSVITVVLPSWYLKTPKAKRNSPVRRARLAVEIGVTRRLLGFDFSDMQVAWVGPEGGALVGKRISGIAREWGVDDLTAYLRLVDMCDGSGRINLYRYYDDGGMVARLLGREDCLCMTDAWMEDDGLQNAAAYMAFPKFLAMSRTEPSLPLHTVVHRMTGATAARYGLRDRGLLRAGYAADVTVFDPATVAPDGEQPRRPLGIRHVYVNGRAIVRDGRADEAAMAGAGHVLRRQ
ncbi:amidohydrolase family protein [Eubacteriales bacterium OttesenSCG-928-A19]|nr:amidohydrolase family protein [Eubacteriales bacterium OttesenSCG-928-A19]